MRHHTILTTLLVALLAVTSASARPGVAAPPRVRVRATGQAPNELPGAREAAVEDALRRCVEAGAGVEIRSITTSRDFMLVNDLIETRTAGYVERYDVLEENPDQQGLYTVRVSAIVTRGRIEADIAAFKSLLRRKGRPTILVGGMIDDEPLDHFTESVVQRQLEHHGITVLESSVLGSLQRKEVLRASKEEDGQAKAAAIAARCGAHILALATYEREIGEPGEVYGIESHGLSILATIKLIEADTGRLLGVEFAEISQSGASPREAERHAIEAATAKAMKLALGRIAAHWLEDVDQRGGAEITLAFHDLSFDRIQDLIRGLRGVPGVKAVIVDSIDPEALGFVRVVSNAPPENLASVIEGLESKVKVLRMTSNRIDIGRR